MKPKFLVLITLLCLVLCGGASAQNMSISRMGYGAGETVQLYTSNGTLLGTYNTSSNSISLPTEDLNLILKPESTDVLSDPMQWVANLFDYMKTNATPIALIVCFIVMIFWRRG